MKKTLVTGTDLREINTHGTTDFPIQYYVDELHLHNRIPLHWHAELEFWVARGSTMKAQLGKEDLIIEDGDGLFINSNTLHSFRTTADKAACPNIVFSPVLIAALSSKIYTDYIQPVITDIEMPYLVLSRKNPCQRKILDLLDKTFSLLQKYGTVSRFYGKEPILQFDNIMVDSVCYEMETQNLLNQIWQLLYSQRDQVPKITNGGASHKLQIRAQKMLEFIQDNYSKKISLNEIASAAIISKSEASRSFHSYLQKSPISYLIDYRLEKAMYLLQQSDDTVAVISDKCGFQSSSYFGKIFLRKIGMTPLQYRKEKAH